MWLVALLVNSNTLTEMTIVWKNICIVLISTNQNDKFKMSLSLLSQMADQMNKDPDKTNEVLKSVTVTLKGQLKSNLDINVSSFMLNRPRIFKHLKDYFMHSKYVDILQTRRANK